MKIIDLREASHHLSTLARWHHEQWSDYNNNETMQQRIERMALYLDDYFIPTTYIAIEDGLLGSAAIVDNDMESRPALTPWLASVYVKPDLRNRGIGSQLVEHVMRSSYDNGIHRLYLFTPDRADFYHKLGWQIMDKETYRGHEVTVMKAELIDILSDR